MYQPLSFLFVSAPIKATEMVFIWEDRRDPAAHFDTKQTLSNARLTRYSQNVLVHQFFEILFWSELQTNKTVMRSLRLIIMRNLAIGCEQKTLAVIRNNDFLAL